MELHGCSVRPSSLLLSTLHTNPNFSYKVPSNFSVVSSVEIKIWNCLSSVRLNASVRRQRFSTQSMWRASNIHSRRHGFYPSKLQKFIVRVRKTVKFTVHFRDRFPEIAFNLVVKVMVFMTISLPVAKSPSWALTEENLLFLEAWRTIDRAYVDKTFNGQSWFRYRENALRSEPMNTREETCGGGSSRGRRQRRGEDVVHPLKVSLEDLYGGTSKKLSLSRNVLCSKCNGKGSKSGASMTCSGCQGSGMKVSIRQLGPSMIQQMQHPCNECKGTGESISDKDRCTQCKGEKVVPEKKVLDVHVEKGMQNGQKITFPGEADEAV